MQQRQDATIGELAKGEHVYRKVALRLIPFLMICYAVAYLDRVNVGFAKLGMSADLRLSEASYGLGAGIFFIGYFIFEVPSNILLHRLGARTWIARIMISWGVVSAACSLMNGTVFFYVARFLLGVAEAGFFPGIILYLTYWFPSARRGQIIAIFMMAIPLAGLVGGPLSGLVMQQFDGLGGWAGWRWMFAVEALPAILLGIAVPFMLTSRVADARWLEPAERARIEADLALELAVAPKHARMRDLLTDPVLLRFGLIYFCIVMGQYGITFWLPTLIASIAKGSSALTVGLLSALPYACAVVIMAVAGRNSDRTGERRWHLVTMILIGAVAIATAPLAAGGGAVASVTLLCVAAAGILTATPLFWNLPTATLAGSAAAVGIAAINSLGNVAGFLSPFLVGWINDLTGAATAGMVFLGAILLAGAAVVLTVKAPPVPRPA